MPVITKHIKDIGEVRFDRSKRSKRLRITLKPLSPVRVSMPYSMPVSEAEKFVVSKKDWILTNLTKMSEREQNGMTIFTPETVFGTYSHVLNMIPIPEKDAKLKSFITSSEIIIKYPAEISPQDQSIQSFTRKAITKALKAEARVFLPVRTAHLAEKFGFKFGKVTVREARTRWGSCSSVDNISLNIHLMRLPEHLRDYVILHELCHTIEKNHGPKFWKLMDKVVGDSNKLNKEIKNFNTHIY